MQEDTVRINEAKEGNERAFRELYEAHVSSLYRFLRQFGSDTDQVQEWVQRAFIKAFEHLGSFDGKARFSSWLFRLALNEMRMDWRRRRAVEFVGADNEAGGQTSDADWFEWNQLMKTWMDELDEMKRAVFILHEVEGYSHAEIGSMLGIAESSSRTFLVRAKRFLKDRWDKETSR